jgi:hypothetical protein
MEENAWFNVKLAAFAVWTFGSAVIGGRLLYNTIPPNSQVQQGYIAPSKLEIKCEDLDQNGKPETIMKIGGKPYLLREVDGKPVLSSYEIIPKE